MTRREAARIAVVVLAGAAALVALIAIVRGSGSYEVHARFVDAGQLVKGGLVQVSGRNIGTITKIELSDDNQADVLLSIDDDDFTPLREGTVAQIRAVGLSGIANRFVEIDPGPTTGKEIPDGGVLPSAKTRPIVDLDQLLDALDPETRGKLQSIIQDSAKIYAGTAAQDANAAIGYLNPATAQLQGLMEELTSDTAAFETLVESSADILTTIAGRSGDVSAGIGTTAAALSAIAAERSSLEESLARAPAVLGQAQGTLRGVRGTLAEVRPALREAQPSAKPLARLLRATVPAGKDVGPVLSDLRRLLPSLRKGVASLPALERAAQPALKSATSAVGGALPIFAGLRPYAPEVVHGLTVAFGGNTAGFFDANGHFARISANGGLAGLTGLTGFPDVNLPLPLLTSWRSGLNARCPGAATQPAPDGSNPWVPDSSICNPEHSP